MIYSDTDIAAVIHDANRRVQIIQGDPAVSRLWDDEDAAIKANAVEGVRKVRHGATARELHEQWRAAKAANGWRYGGAKDTAARTHPCMVPYDELPEDQRDKNELFIAIVRALYAKDEPPVQRRRAARRGLGPARPAHGPSRTRGGRDGQ